MGPISYSFKLSCFKDC